MDTLKKYRKLRFWLETLSGLISLIVGIGISSGLGFYGSKLFSLGTIYSIGIIVVVSLTLGNISVRIADKWYETHKSDSEEQFFKK